MRLRLEIETMDTAAFGDNMQDARVEIARLLQEAALSILKGSYDDWLHDYNGNRVGEWAIEDE